MSTVALSRLTAAFTRARSEARLAIVPYVTAGYPDVQTTLALVPALVEAGADVVELGVPFSDPLADGVTIQRASQAALDSGMTPRRCLELAGKLSEKVPAPIVLMGYYNPIFAYGAERYCRDAAEAGVAGLIVPDLPPEEAGELLAPARAHGIDLVFLLAPTSTDERVARVCEAASGFVYLASVSGVTGARRDLSGGVAELAARVRKRTSLPLAVGFGISRPEHVAALRGVADGAIIGSALIDRLDALPVGEKVTGTADYLRSLRMAASF